MANDRMVMADRLINGSGDALGGFNARLFGESPQEAYGYSNHPSTVGPRSSGYWLADKMIKEGKIFYIQPFPHKPCDKTGFPYGGSWVCNDCSHAGLERPWWCIKVYADGNSWCCVGEEFEDLQASENYAFGATREEAIKNYGELMLATQKE